MRPIYIQTHEMSHEDFNQLLLPMSTELYRRAFCILHNEKDAEDAVQDVFLKLWHEREKLDEVDNLSNYLRTCLRNHCISLLRMRRKEVEVEQLLDSKSETANTPLENAEQHSDRQLMQELIARTPPKVARVLRLHLYAEMQAQEIARLVGESEQNIRATLSRYRRKLVEDFRRCLPPNEIKK